MIKQSALVAAVLLAGCGTREPTAYDKAAADLNKTRQTLDKNVKDRQDSDNARAAGQARQ